MSDSLNRDDVLQLIDRFHADDARRLLADPDKRHPFRWAAAFVRVLGRESFTRYADDLAAEIAGLEWREVRPRLERIVGAK